MSEASRLADALPSIEQSRGDELELMCALIQQVHKAETNGDALAAIVSFRSTVLKRYADEALEALRTQAAALAEREWIAVSERLPEPGFPVLVVCGSRVLRAAHAPRFTLSCDAWGEFEPDGGEYDEATEACYWPEGWYEWNQHEETHWRLDAEPTHWQPLPAPPLAAAPSPNKEQTK